MAVFQADELEIVYEGEERREGEEEEEEEAKDRLLPASGLVLLKLRHELRFRRGVQEGGEQVLGNDAEQKQGGEGAKSWRCEVASSGTGE